MAKRTPLFLAAAMVVLALVAPQLAATALAARAPANKLKKVVLRRDRDKITARYRFREPVDVSQVQVEHAAGRIFLTFPDTTYGRKRMWIAGGGRAFRESRVDRLPDPAVRHTLRLRKGHSFPREHIRMASDGKDVVVRFYRGEPPPEEARGTAEVPVVSAASGSDDAASTVGGAKVERASQKAPSDSTLAKVLEGLAAPARKKASRDGGAPSEAETKAQSDTPKDARGLVAALGGGATSVKGERASELELGDRAGTLPATAALPGLGAGVESSSGKLMLMAFLMVGFLAIGYPLFRRMRKRKLASGAGIEVLDRRAVGPKHQLCLVAVGARHLLIGSGEGGVQLLTEVEPAASHKAAASGDAFPDLGSLLGGLTQPRQPEPLPAPVAPEGSPAATWSSTAQPLAQGPARVNTSAGLLDDAQDRRARRAPQPDGASLPRVSSTQIPFAAIRDDDPRVAAQQFARAAAVGESPEGRLHVVHPEQRDPSPRFVSEMEQRLRQLRAV